MTTRTRKRLPAAPLVAVIDRLRDDLGVNPRNLTHWRHHPDAHVSAQGADRALTRSPYLWFDVWPECAEHERPAAGCEACEAFYKARLVFTGTRMPLEFGRQR